MFIAANPIKIYKSLSTIGENLNKKFNKLKFISPISPEFIEPNIISIKENLSIKLSLYIYIPTYFKEFTNKSILFLLWKYN